MFGQSCCQKVIGPQRRSAGALEAATLLDGVRPATSFKKSPIAASPLAWLANAKHNLGCEPSSQSRHRAYAT